MYATLEEFVHVVRELWAEVDRIEQQFVMAGDCDGHKMMEEAMAIAQGVWEYAETHFPDEWEKAQHSL